MGGAAAVNTPGVAAESIVPIGAGIAAPPRFRFQQPVMPGSNTGDADVETNDDHEGTMEEPDGDVGEQENGGDEIRDGVDCIQEGVQDGENAGC